MIRLDRAAMAGLLLLAGAAVAGAEPVTYVVVPERSSVEFRYTENGIPRTGVFARFIGSGQFDVDAPEDAKLSFRVESASIDLGNTLVNAFAQSSEWFDSQNHPHVLFRLTGLESIGPERYIAEGVLSIRGRERAISAPVTLEFGEGEVRAEGDLRVDRVAYGLGTGVTRAFVTIGREVSVLFDLTARPVE